MAFRGFTKSDLVAGAIVVGGMALIFAAAAIFGESLGVQMQMNGRTLRRSDPNYADKLVIWRAGMFGGALLCALFSWISYHFSRRVAD